MEINWKPGELMMNEQGWWDLSPAPLLAGDLRDAPDISSQQELEAHLRTSRWTYILQIIRREGGFMRVEAAHPGGFKPIAYACDPCDRIHVGSPRMAIGPDRHSLEYRCAAGHLIGEHIQK